MDDPGTHFSSSAGPERWRLGSHYLDPVLSYWMTGLDPSSVARKPVGNDEPFDPPKIAGYDVIDELGRGGMGIVYRAYDRRRKQVVAMKTMRRADPAALYRIKQEFRSLADVSHANLVSLHELISDGKSLFLTMELVSGLDLLGYIRSPIDRAAQERDEDLTTSAMRATGGDLPDTEPAVDFLEFAPRAWEAWSAAPADPPSGLVPFQLARLRRSFRQLAEGVLALHGAGRLHRDLKPSNVLVTRRGRVVILDFGLVIELGTDRARHDSSPELIGTVAYMAPEQAAGGSVSPATDWYSVGVMLYEALTGYRPFRGRPLDVMMEKQKTEPPAPRELVADVPDDLNTLCVDLLRLHPDDRPCGADVLRRLGPTGDEDDHAGPVPPSPSASGQVAPLVGRGPHLEALGAAIAEVERGRPVAIRVHGPVGSGKTALVRHFLRGLAEGDRAVVLQGRCYERESMPFKALDSVVDDLGRFLRQLPEAEARALLPRDITPLVRVFPALRRVEAVAAAPRLPADPHDPPELRRRAFLALRELLARLGDRKPVVVVIDDLQWGDRDSAEAIAELLRNPDPPALLLIVCHRSEDAAANPLVARLGGAEIGSGFLWRELTVGALSRAEAEDLASCLIDPQNPSAVALSTAIACESGGHPFFLTELVRHLQHDGLARAGSPRIGGGTLTLEEVLLARVDNLPEEARRLLEVVAVSGRPIGEAEACRAAGLAEEPWSSLSVLRAARLIRGTGQACPDEVETYHDCVREAVTSRLSPEELTNHHLRLALAHETSGRAAPEVLAHHFRKAGRPYRAWEYYTKAADRAAEALAFEHAATLYRLAWEQRPPGPDPEPALLPRLASALANAGRGREAADQYMAAAEAAPPSLAFELRRRAATQLLISGEIDAGLTALDDVLRAVGIGLPATPRRALASLLWNRLRLKLRGLSFRRRGEREISADDLRRLDVCWSASTGLGMVDYIRGGDFQTRHLLLALRAGEPRRIAKGLAWEAMQSSVCPEGLARGGRLLKIATRLAEELDEPYLHAMVAMSSGIAAYLQGRWSPAEEALARAEGLFSTRCVGVSWELDTTRTFLLWCMTYLGHGAELTRRHEELSREAQSRGDLFAAMNLGTYTLAVVRMWEDEPEAGLAEMERVTRLWSQRGFHIQHYNALLGRAMLDLYAGRGGVALDLIHSQWPAYRGSCLIRVQETRIELVQLRAHVALAIAGTAPDSRPFLRAARRDARSLEAERVPWSVAHAAMIRGGLARLQGDLEFSRRWYTSAAAGFASADMPLYSEAAECRLGQLQGGPEGAIRVDEALGRMTRRSVRNPVRLVAMYAPGFPDDHAAALA